MSCAPSIVRLPPRQTRRELGYEPDTIARRVLVVDDSSDGRRMISGILECLGLDATLADDGRTACELALAASKHGEPFDLILMDTHMPYVDGYEATALLRSMGYTGGVVALASGSSFERVHEKCAAAGCDGYASKPITFGMLRDLVHRHLPPARPGSRGHVR